MRMRLFLSAAEAGREREQLEQWMRHSFPRFGDGMLRFSGIGEVVHYGCHAFEGLEEFSISDDAARDFERISRIAAERGWPMQVHAVLDESIDRSLTCWEAVNERIPLAGLALLAGPRRSHQLTQPAPAGRLGCGRGAGQPPGVQGRVLREGVGRGLPDRNPPIADMIAAGIPLAGGTDPPEHHPTTPGCRSGG
ncbi:amidohydrolase family protein [Streptomyces sp. RS2]|nr:amidohydrolase family protein [Streptomyces sp. RS2]MCW1100256.1 amidohydrolase family protein [Streptomyces sp. RS2]